ncbi:hypothetical protein DPMN_074478 [Dreissena polymorpha]|uniref:Uncharacterized protein n=1 Tax=Dreissena polymorpha TaxID=45954 RepID=A0A9D3YFF6_DREPO|nr:hypothetical protein DPMN_074478 [Dreissena polymorpha]
MAMSDNDLVFTPYMLQTSCMINVRKLLGALQHSSHHPSRYNVEDTDDERKGCEERDFTRYPYMQEAFLMQLAANKWPCNYIQPNLRNITLETNLPKHLEFVDFHEGNIIYNEQINYNITPNANTIKHIDLSNDVFNIFTNQYGPFPNIEVSNLSRCYIMQIGEKSLNYPLKILRLDNNYLGNQLADSVGSSIFECLTSLKTLNLLAIGITILHRSTFAPLTNLTDLDLSNNNIGNLVMMLPSLTNLSQIDLHVNSLYTLARNIRTSLELNAKKLNSTFEIDLRNNSLDYSCENQDFLNWLYEHKSNMKTVFRLSDERIMDATCLEKEFSNLEGNCRSYTLLIVLCCIGIS